MLYALTPHLTLSTAAHASRVTRKLEEGRTVAAYTFSGLPLDWWVLLPEPFPWHTVDSFVALSARWRSAAASSPMRKMPWSISPRAALAVCSPCLLTIAAAARTCAVALVA